MSLPSLRGRAAMPVQACGPVASSCLVKLAQRCMQTPLCRQVSLRQTAVTKQESRQPAAGVACRGSTLQAVLATSPWAEQHLLCRHIGLWRTRVLEREVTQRGRPRFSTTPGAAVESAQPQLRILVGDDSGCRSEVMVPYDPL